MILDERTEFADATSIGTPNNATVNVGDVIDLSIIGRDAGQGQPLYCIFQVTTTFTSGGATLLSLLIVSDSTGTPAVDDTQTIHYESSSEDDSYFTAGKTFVVPLPAVDPTYERFLGVQVRNRAAVAVTGGAINAFLTLDPTGWKAYPDAIN